MSGKIVQLNEEVIKGQLKELVRGQRRGDAERAAGEGIRYNKLRKLKEV